MNTHPFRVGADPRHLVACAACGLPIERHEQQVRPRDRALEMRLVDVAARAAGRFTADGAGDDRGLYALADRRARPGGVRADLDAIREISEELADAANYALWGIEAIHAPFLAGDHDATSQYDRLMRFLTRLVDAWHELHTTSA